MLAVDSNVLVRFFVNDDVEQARRARRLVEEASIYVCTTVWLETEWVLRSTYKLRPPSILQLLRAFAGLPSVTAEDPSRLASALAAMERGVDFADALHLGGAVGCEAFVTFDRALERRAGGLW
ncbi:MAG: type II toxin-antitoxin system VapC family toxin, partial [Caulobacteraceae bacterium]